MKFCHWVGLLVVAMAFPAGLQAAQSTAQEDFRSGISAFRDGDIDRARLLLERAREAGLESSSLLYNLGVIYYRLELFEQAEASFTELLDTPHAPLARYNLGLVLQSKGDQEGARAWFAQAADDSSPDEVQTLAQQQLASDSSRNSSARPETDTGSTRMVGFLSTAAGFDNNIAGAPGDAITEESGVFGDLLASGRVYLNQSGGNAWRLDAVAYTRQYPGNADFDNAYFSGGAAWQQSLEAASLVSGITVSGFWYGADLLEQQVQLDTTYERPGCFWPDVLRADCRLRVFAAKIQGGPDFSAYDGESYGGELNIEKNTERWNLESSYRLGIDRRRDLETDTEFFSLSPTRHTLSVSAERKVTSQLGVGVKQTVRLSRYDDPHRLAENGEIGTGTRDDEQFRTLLFGGYQLDRRWRLGIEAGWVENQSSLDRYGYDRAEMLVSLDGIF